MYIYLRLVIQRHTKIGHRNFCLPATAYATCILRSMNNAWERMDYRVDIMGMINSWRVMKGAFVVALSLLRFTEFRKGRHGVLYVVRFLETFVEATVSGSNVSAFDVST